MSNLPHEPEFEQAYKGAIIVTLLRQSILNLTQLTLSKSLPRPSSIPAFSTRTQSTKKPFRSLQSQNESFNSGSRGKMIRAMSKSTGAIVCSSTQLWDRTRAVSDSTQPSISLCSSFWVLSKSLKMLLQAVSFSMITWRSVY